jgi:hypothetical protein
MLAFDKLLVPQGHRALAEPWRNALHRWLVQAPGRQWVVRKGRRIGASTVICPRLIAAWIMIAGPLLSLPPGEQCIIGLISIKREESANRINQITAVLDQVGIAYQARAESIKIIDLPITIKVLTRNWRSIVGETIGMLWADEVSRWESDDSSANPAAEVMSALLPSTATIPTALVALVSSPWSESDYHAECYDRGNNMGQMTAFLPTATVIPELSEDVTRLLEPDDSKWQREYGAIPSGTVSAALDPADINKLQTIAPIAGKSTFLAIDASSLRNDGFSWIAGNYSTKGIYIRECEEINPKKQKLQMIEVVDKIVDRCKAYNVNTVYGDQREEAGLASLFTMRNITFISYSWSDRSKEDAFSLLRRLMRDNKLSTITSPDLIKEMLKCKVALMPSGRTKYITQGLDRLSALVTLCHAIVDKKIVAGTDSELDWDTADKWNSHLSGRMLLI